MWQASVIKGNAGEIAALAGSKEVRVHERRQLMNF
jgi:hydroxyethylthiazole kinase-like sugar kinase family protein